VRRPISGLLVALLLAVPALAPSVPASAQQAPAGDEVIGVGAQPRRIPNDTALERKVKEVSSQLRCPVCQGLSLADSPSELSQEMKSVVRDQLAAGRSPDEVKGYFVSKYGEWILMEPTRRGFNWAVYLLPVVVVAAGAGVIAVAVRRWTRRPPGEDGAGERAPLEDELEDEWGDTPVDARGR
jgi:cytochrome c-type biogenesis protein CcmH